MTAPDPQRGVKPRVLFVDHVGVLGGAELCLIDAARHMKDRCTVLLFAEGPLRTTLESSGVTVKVVALNSRAAAVSRKGGLLAGLRAVPHLLWTAWRTAREATHHDVIWATSQKAFVIACIASLVRRRPLVWHLHDILSKDHFSRANRWIVTFLANRFADRVVTVSRCAEAGYVASGGTPRLSRVVYNGIDAESFLNPENQTEVASGIRREFGIGGAPLVGIFGRLSPWKGQDVLIRAMVLLPGIHALVVGDALFGESRYVQSLDELVKQLNLTNRVHFCGFRNDISSLMAAVDVVIHASTAPEPFGRVLVEAMLVRTPLIAANEGGAAEIITDGIDGVLIPPGDPDLLAKAIQSIVSDPSKQDAMVEAGYQTAIQRFSLKNYLDGLECVLEEVTGAKTPTGQSSVADQSKGLAIGRR
jgi:glycosyltransferase involved in cell wall biosynthesis